jgi:hypothetical protein
LVVRYRPVSSRSTLTLRRPSTIVAPSLAGYARATLTAATAVHGTPTSSTTGQARDVLRTRGARPEEWVTVAMTTIRVSAAVGLLTMLAMVVRAFGVASFTDDGAALVDLAWGQVTLVDLYLALLLGWLWIVWQERSPLRAALWLVATVTLGSIALLGYVLVAALRADTPTALLLGPHRGGGADAEAA